MSDNTQPLLSGEDIDLTSISRTDSSNSVNSNIEEPTKTFPQETSFLDQSFLYSLDQLYNNPLFFMQPNKEQRPSFQPYSDPNEGHELELVNSQESNYLKNSNMSLQSEGSESTLMQSISDAMDPLKNIVSSGEQPLSIWSGLNNFFSNVAHNNLFPIALPNFARSFSEYITNHPVPFLSSLNPSNPSSVDPSMCYKRETSSTGLQIRVLGIPQTGAKSRVETQIKLCIQLVTDNGDKAQWWSHLKLPEQMITKDKTKKQLIRSGDVDQQPVNVDKLLYLRARVICASDPSKKRKRSQRRKDSKISLELEEIKQDDDSCDEGRTLLFNCAEIVDFSSGDTILPTRITCYCRHHNERIGFCILFEMVNHNGEKVAEGISPPIMITDDHKSNKIKTGSKRRRTESEVPELPAATPFNWMKTFPFANNKINDTPSYAYPLQSSSSSITSDDMKSSYSLHPSSTIHLNQPQYSPPASVLPVNPPTVNPPTVNPPVMRRLIPNEAPISGGIAITILGTDFRPGLTVMFGDTPATNIQYWSTNTLICTLPSVRQPGAVVVSFKEVNLVSDNSLMIFTYSVETDRALMELALQVVGMKMTGIVEDARKIAMRIVQGSGNSDKTKKSRSIESLNEKQPL
ncbi:hypothetical protein BDB01DRAFT_895919 [Pilobolus umbonatus]|nr:hypothetical protein BDB01DRAFT_895919 [Pilobolus umbonatus]